MRGGSELPPPAELEVVLGLPENVFPARHIRSTLLVQSIQNLRSIDAYERWLAVLPVVHRDVLVHAVPGAWLSIEIARAHYAACDTLALGPEKQTEMGKATLDRVGRALVGTMSHVSQAVGATPWAVLPHLQRFWERGFDGGAIGVHRLGERDARIDLVGCVLSESVFFRSALRGWTARLTEPLCEKVVVSEHRPQRTGAVCLRVHWA